MKLTFYPYTLELKNKFSLSHHSRTTTPVVLTEISFEGFIGYGEASLPPYLAETQESVISFLSKVNIERFRNPLELNEILEYVDNIDKGNNAAKASIDIALHDLAGKILNIPLHKYFGVKLRDNIYSSMTIGIDTEEKVLQKVKDAEQFKILKVKVGSDFEKSMIESIRKITDKPILIDANQGWKDKFKALEFVSWLADYNIKLIEQPFNKNDLENTSWLTERSPLPIYADESVLRLNDIEKFSGVFSGINIKLMKSTGLAEAFQMIKKAKQLGLEVMLGCMTETSCAISAASHLATLADWVDLDGAELIRNDPFSGMEIVGGKLFIPEFAGSGAIKIPN